MKRKRGRDINIFSVSFLDVLANTIGGLAFLLVVAFLLVSNIVFAPPRITTETLPQAYHNFDYAVWLGARDGLGKFTWNAADDPLPPGLNLDPETGKLSGRVALSESDGARRDFEFEVICASEAPDAQQVKEDRRRFVLSVARDMPAPSEPLRMMTDNPLPPAYRGRDYPLAFSAQGGVSPYKWSITDAPAGLDLTQEGLIHGAPSAVGMHVFSVTVEAQGDQVTRPFSLEVGELYPPPPPIPPLRVLTDLLPDAVADRPYSLRLAADGGTPPYRWSIVSGGPNWLSTKDGESFSGQPGLTNIGTSTVTWLVDDSAGQSARAENLDLQVLPPVGEKPPPLLLRTLSLPDARVGDTYAVAAAAEGGFPPYVWTASGTFSNHSLEFTDEGEFRGAIRDVGKAEAIVTVTDRSGQQQQAEFEFNVHPGIEPLVITTSAAPPGRAGMPYALWLAASGGYPPYRWTLNAGELPPGTNFDGETGALQGVPSEAGMWAWDVSVADAEGRTAGPAHLELDLFTAQGYRKLEITTKQLPRLLYGVETGVALACQGGEPPYHWEDSGTLPAGLTISETMITGSPSVSGRYEIKLAVADRSGERANTTLSLEVRRMVDWWLALTLAVVTLAAVLLALAFFYLWVRYRGLRSPLRIVTQTLPNARASQQYDLQLACEGGVPPYTWSVTDGTLPPGLSLSPEGLLSGRPFEGIGVNATKEMMFTVEVRDRVGSSARQTV